MGMIVAILVSAVLPKLILGGGIVGLLVGLLPKQVRRATLIGLAVLVAVLVGAGLASSSRLTVDVLVLFVVASGLSVVAGLAVMLVLRKPLLSAFAALWRSPPPVRALAVCAVLALVTYPSAKRWRVSMQRTEDLRRLAGEWYGIDPFYRDGATYRIDISPEGLASVRFDRDVAVGMPIEVADLHILGPHVIDLTASDAMFGPATLTSRDVAFDDWPAAVVENVRLTRVGDGASPAIALSRLIRATADADHQAAMDRLARNRQALGSEGGTAAYEYVEDLAAQIHVDGVGPIYRFNDLPDVFATFRYGAAHYSRDNGAPFPCRVLYGLVYRRDGDAWTRLEAGTPGRICDYGARLPCPVTDKDWGDCMPTYHELDRPIAEQVEEAVRELIAPVGMSDGMPADRPGRPG